MSKKNKRNKQRPQTRIGKQTSPYFRVTEGSAVNYILDKIGTIMQRPNLTGEQIETCRKLIDECNQRQPNLELIMSRLAQL